MRHARYQDQAIYGETIHVNESFDRLDFSRRHGDRRRTDDRQPGRLLHRQGGLLPEARCMLLVTQGREASGRGDNGDPGRAGRPFVVQSTVTAARRMPPAATRLRRRTRRRPRQPTPALWPGWLAAIRMRIAARLIESAAEAAGPAEGLAEAAALEIEKRSFDCRAPGIQQPWMPGRPGVEIAAATGDVPSARKSPGVRAPGLCVFPVSGPCRVSSPAAGAARVARPVGRPRPARRGQPA